MALVPSYQFGKGPIAVTLEQFLASRENAIELVRNLEAKDAFGDNSFVQRLAKAMPPEKDHLADVVGTGKADNAEQKQRSLVYGQGLLLAIRLALDLGPNDRAEDVPPEGKNPYPVEILWACGHQYNQAWVSTRPLADGGRLITIVFYSTEPATALMRSLLKEQLDWKNGPPDVRLDVQELVVCHGDRGDGGAEESVKWFRPPLQMGIPPEPA